MREKKIIALIVGASGSGKTTVCQKLEEKYGMKQVVSYTTRPRRNEKEDSHIFITEQEVPDKSQMCAYTIYNGHQYFATNKQIEDADLYVIDPAGVNYFYKHYNGTKVPRIIKIDVPIQDRLMRMQRRGDSGFEAMQRCELDKRVFSNFAYDFKIENKNVEECADAIYEYLVAETADLSRKTAEDYWR